MAGVSGRFSVRSKGGSPQWEEIIVDGLVNKTSDTLPKPNHVRSQDNRDNVAVGFQRETADVSRTVKCVTKTIHWC